MQKVVLIKDGQICSKPVRYPNTGDTTWVPYYPLENRPPGADTRMVISEDGESVREEVYVREVGYIAGRVLSYPDIEEQLDKLFHDIDNGSLDKTGEFYSAIKNVKDSYPK